MSDGSDNEIERAPSPDTLYLHSYLPTHIAYTSAHFCTPLPTASHFKAFPLTREEVIELSAAKDEAALGHMFFPPSTYWSPHEKALFFRALASSSRLRPDIIAERIGTKTSAEVEAYISMLDSALNQTPDEELLPRAKFPLAHEAPEELIEYEEDQAKMCADYEEEYGEEIVKESRREEEREWRKEKGIGTRLGRPRKGGRFIKTDEKRDREAEAAHRADIIEWRCERQPVWEAEDALRSMDIVELGALDRLIKRDERQNPTDDNEAENAVIVPDLLPGQRATSDPREPEQPEAGPSRPTTPAPASTSAPVTPSGVDDEEDPGNLSPASKSRLRKRLWMRRKRAAAKGEVADMSRTLLKPGKKAKGAKAKAVAKTKGKGKAGADSDSEEDVEEDGDEESSLPKDDKGKGKTAAPVSGDEAEEIVDLEDDQGGGEEEDEEDDERKPTKKRTWAERREKGHEGGLTKPYKFEQMLRTSGFNGAALQEQGLGGLLSYKGLGKLSRIYASLEIGTPPDDPPKLSSDFLRYLETLVRTYARRIIGMAIRVRELDFALKGHTKVWRLGKRRMILKHHIGRALALAGSPRVSKKAYFEALAERMGDKRADGGGRNTVEDEEIEDEDEEDEDEDGHGREDEEEEDHEDADEESKAANAGVGWINRHGQLVAPFWPPRAFVSPYIATSHLPSIPTTYPFGIDTPGTRPRLAPAEHTARLAIEVEAVEDLMESDAAELARELQEDERLNEVDEKKGERDGVRVMVALGLIAPPESTAASKKKKKKSPILKRKAPTINEDSDEEGDARPSKRTRRQGGAPAPSAWIAVQNPDGVRVKSAAYVVDSDEDL